VKQELDSPLGVAGLEWAHVRHSATLGARGAIAQLGERLDRTQEVAGSSPASSINTAANRPFLLGESA
jgi:hypothetical protein